jgi:hypothetical protein
MSNFSKLLENENYNVLVPTIIEESFNDLICSLNEEDIQKVQEYCDLIKENKLKRSLEEEISEAIMPIIEHNTVLYGSFLYETEVLEEGCCSDAKNILENLRSMVGKEFIAEVSDTTKRRMKQAGTGVGAAGTGAAIGLTAAAKKNYDKSLMGKLGIGSDSIGSHFKRGIKNVSKGAADKFEDVKDKLGY